MKPCALGLKIIARSHGSLYDSPALMAWALATGADATTVGRSPLRLTATVVAGGNAGATRAPPGAVGVGRASVAGVVVGA